MTRNNFPRFRTPMQGVATSVMMIGVANVASCSAPSPQATNTTATNAAPAPTTLVVAQVAPGNDQAASLPIATSVRIYPRAGYGKRLAGSKIQGSNQNATSGFVDLATVKALPEGKWTQIALKNKKPYQFLRLFGVTNSWASVAELQFYAGKTRIQGMPYGTFGSRNNSGNTYDKAFDGKTNTFFEAAAPNSQYLGIALQSSAPSAPVSAGTTPTPSTAPVAGSARRHYHIGNSLTDTIGEFAQATAIAAGYKDDFFDRQTIPGSPLRINWEAKQGFGTPYATAFVKDAPLTDLVMQPFINNGDGADAEYSVKFYDLAKQNSPQVKPWIYGQWPVTGTGGNKSGSADWEARTMGYMRVYVSHAINFAQQRPDAGVRVIPGGLGLINLKKAIEAGKVPGITNFFPTNFDDDLHVSGVGRYFIGLVTYASIYDQSPVGVPAAGIGDKPVALTPEQVKVYQQIAWDTVSNFKKSGGVEVGLKIPAQISAKSNLYDIGEKEGFIQYINQGSTFDYLVTAPAAGNYRLNIGAGVAEPNAKIDILVDGKLAQTLTLTKGTAAEPWNDYVDSPPATLNLKQGLNLITLRAVTNRGYNLKYLKFSAG